MRSFAVICLMCYCSLTYSQEYSFSADTVGMKTVSDNIYNRSAFSDSLASSFCIVIKKGVKPHKHEHHSEHVVVVEGEGSMKVGGKAFTIKKGDLIFIPKNTVHSVVTTGKIPLKVYSIQSPLFVGKDRVMVNE